MKKASEVELGDRVKDRITGFSGIAVARVEWLYGCERFAVQPETLAKDGKYQDNQYFDAPQLAVVAKQVVENPARRIARGSPERDHGGGRDDAKAFSRG